MKLNKFLKISISTLFAFPISIFFGNEMLANHLPDKIDYELNQENLLACGGGGGGGGASPAQKKAAAAKKAKSKLMFKKRKLSEKAAAGQDTTELQSEIAELEALIAD